MKLVARYRKGSFRLPDKLAQRLINKRPERFVPVTDEDPEELLRKQEEERLKAEEKARKAEEKRLLKEQKEAEKKAKKEAKK